MCSGVSKSGSPAPRPITSLPCARRRAARAVTAMVGEGLTRWTRRETGRVTDFPLVRLCFELAAILRDCGGAGHRGTARRRNPYPNLLQRFRMEKDQRPFKLE